MQSLRRIPRQLGNSGKRRKILLLIRILFSSRGLATTALAVWLGSLPLVVFNYYSILPRDLETRGYVLLLIGWLSPIVLNFAWFANIFLLFGIWWLLVFDGAPFRSAITALILAFDALPVTAIPQNEGTDGATIYGYGWGAVLWFLSIFLFLIATGARRSENYETDIVIGREWFRPIGIVLSVLLLSVTGYFFAHDRLLANYMESRHLAGIVAKRGTVCSTREPSVAEPIRNFGGTLEVVRVNPVTVYPLLQVNGLLRWGVKVVRMKGMDYRKNTESRAPRPKPFKMPARGTPDAVLFVSADQPEVVHGWPVRQSRLIRAKLVDRHTSRVVFDQIWRREELGPNDHSYCPNYHSFPGINDQPRLLLSRSLGLI